MTKSPLFSQAEFNRRKEALQTEMARRNTQLVLLEQPEMMFHFIGYAMSEGYQQFCVVPLVGDPIMVIRSVDEGTCQEFSYIPDSNIVGFRDWDDPLETLKNVLVSRGMEPTAIGVDRNSYNLTLLRFDALKKAFPDTSFVDFSDFLIDFRAQKSNEELEMLRRSSEIADRSISALLEEIRPGYSARECVGLASKHVIRLGGDLGVIGVVTRAIDDTKMHAIVDDIPLGEGALLHVELIPQYQGYSSRIMRPVYFGRVPEEISQIGRMIVNIQDRQFAAMKPGAKASDVDAIIRNGMLDAGLKESYKNISGYSLGYYQPFTCRSSDFSFVFRPGDTWTLRENMVFHMYTVAKGLAFSETVIVTPEGGVRLTQTPREVLSLPISRVERLSSPL